MHGFLEVNIVPIYTNNFCMDLPRGDSRTSNHAPQSEAGMLGCPGNSCRAQRQSDRNVALVVAAEWARSLSR
jgi:hypothetical protein